MRNPNGYGGVRKLSGKRRRPFAAVITTQYELTTTRKDISFLQEILDPDLFARVQQQYDERCPAMPKAKRKQQIIGYYETRQDALIALAEYNRNPYDIDKRATTFEQIYNILLENTFSQMKATTKSGYTTAYDKCGALYNMRMQEIRKAHMQAVVDEHNDKSKATQNNLLKLFHAVFKFALENDIIEKDYSAFVETTSKKESKNKTPFTRDEIAALWEKLDYTITSNRKGRASLDGLQLVDSILVMLYTGVRIGELLDIKAGDVNLAERCISLRGTKTKAAQRIVPLHKKILPLIEKRIAGKTADELLFPNNTGDPIIPQVYRARFFDPLCDDLKMDHTPHECRHSFATYAAASKLNPILVKKIIGHSAQDITQDIYTHAMIDDLVAEIDKLKL